MESDLQFYTQDFLSKFKISDEDIVHIQRDALSAKKRMRAMSMN